MSSSSTAIEWTDETWNPTTGCSKVSEGCRHCYAERISLRFGHSKKPWTKPNAPENVVLHPERLEKPLRWRKPRRVFVDSMSDLFHELVPDDFIDRVFAVMGLAERHTFQILTKRPERMAEYVNDYRRADAAADIAFYMNHRQPLSPEMQIALGRGRFAHSWPPRNIWLGTSVEDQRAADERIPHLLRTPAAVRFLSCEPLLGLVDLFGDVESPGPAVTVEGGSYPVDYGTGREYDAYLQPQLDWVIVGGESGPGFRPMDPDWARSLRDQCVSAGVAFFFKQWGGTRPKAGGRELDGRVYDEMPAAWTHHLERLGLTATAV